MIHRELFKLNIKFNYRKIAFNTPSSISHQKKLVELVRWMGGRVLKLKQERGNSLSDRSDCWRLVAHRTKGPSFREAVSRDIPVVNSNYVRVAWEEKRHLPKFRAGYREFTQLYRRKPFEECEIIFLGIVVLNHS